MTSTNPEWAVQGRARFLPAIAKIARFAMNRRGLESRLLDVGGRRVHVYDGKGTGSLPPLVLVHGLGSAGAAFARVAARLLPHFQRVIIPELPGHGFSPHGGVPITPALLLESTTLAIEHLLREPAFVYGNSLGGAIAIKYALHRPESVRGLVLVSPAGARLADDEWRSLVETFRVKGPRDAREFLARLYHKPPWFLPIVAQEFPHLLATPAVREILEHATQENAHRPEELGALAMPVLFVWGRSEKLLPSSALAFFREHLPKHAVVEEPFGFGHTPQLETPDRVADRILAFARAHAEAPKPI
ncbi:MAG: alpha/beta hydrolase [Deltaproteobacteria bacterium]|nr:alpha/beta hydrolase [Deltaproteobacteria bacterium]